MTEATEKVFWTTLLPTPEPDEIKAMLKRLSHGKAISFDMFSDVVLASEEGIKRLSNLLEDLGSEKLKSITLSE